MLVSVVAFASAVAGAMTQGPHDEGAIGLIRRALLLRAKYRIQTEKIKIPLAILGVHPANRAGVYPMEETVMNLGLSLLSGGFSVEEADHEGVCVQEVPVEEQRHAQLITQGAYETYLAYNKRKTAAVAALLSTFSMAHSVAYGTLSHSHLLLVLRALSSDANWPIGRRPCHSLGHLRAAM